MLGTQLNIGIVDEAARTPAYQGGKETGMNPLNSASPQVRS